QGSSKFSQLKRFCYLSMVLELVVAFISGTRSELVFVFFWWQLAYVLSGRRFSLVRLTALGAVGLIVGFLFVGAFRDAYDPVNGLTSSGLRVETLPEITATTLSNVAGKSVIESAITTWELFINRMVGIASMIVIYTYVPSTGHYLGKYWVQTI